MLDQLKLLRHHDVDAPEARGYFIDGRPPHATAVLVEKATGTKWSINSWTVGYGQALEVMPLERWKAINSAALTKPIRARKKRNARGVAAGVFNSISDGSN